MNNAKLYAQNNQIQRPLIAAVLKNHLNKFQWRRDGKDTLIDIGSGTGDVLIELICPLMAKDFQRIVCSDLCSNMVNYAKTKYEHVKNTEFKMFDIGTEAELPSDFKGQFDHVVSFHCLHFIPNQMKAFENIFQLLRPDAGGNCLVNMLARGSYYDACIAMSKSLKWSQYMTDIDKYTCYWHKAKDAEQEARDILEKIGFIEIDVKLYQVEMDFESVASFKEMLLAVSPYIPNIPKQLHQEFLTELVDAMSYTDNSDKTESNEKYRFIYEQLVVFARRPALKSNKI